jgi:hypothetical protein
MVIKVVDQIDEPELLENLWGLYLEAFADLNANAVQRHLMYRPEFDDVMSDVRIQKYLSLDDDGTVLGVATYTNDLFAVPLISPPYFEKNWPDHYATHRIWYIVFVAVRPDQQGSFQALVEQMYLIASAQNGLVGLDICTYNDDVRNMSRIFRVLIRRLTANMRFERIDQQSFWLYEFPAEVPA